ncbi:MAG TPA: TetR/AcrR family transcriptional regulator [Actinomycetes bacterium]|nr:TetR/AcrR family transcriptional regulator [Actinomycetes bacterium]
MKPDQRRTTAQGEATRQKILDVAGPVFADVGYADAKLEDIAAEVGVTKGAVLRHFGSKEQLFVASYKNVMANNSSWLDVPEAVLTDGFYAVLSYWWTKTASHSADSLPLRMYFLGRSCGDRNAQQQINRFLRSEDPDRTIEFVEFGISTGEIAPSHDPLLVAAILDWILDGFQGSAFSDDLDRSGLFRQANVERTTATAESLVSMLKRAFGT